MVTLNNTAFVAVTGNGLTVCDDLVRRFLVCELDARCENPEQRRFEPGLLANIEGNRARLLGAALTIWRWGRQQTMKPGLALGSYPDWEAWCRDPLVALGCCDPVERIDRIKADDPSRRQVVDLFNRWHACHGSQPMKVTELAKSVTAIIDPRRRGRYHIETRLMQMVGTCAGGFTLTKQDAAAYGHGGYAFAVRATMAEAAGRDEIALVPPQQGNGLITIDIGSGRTIHVDPDFDARALERILEVLDRRR